MKKYFNLLILIVFISVFGTSHQVYADTKGSWWGWSKHHDHDVQMQNYNPYLENSRHMQIPQWEHKDWYAEDWLSQKDGMELVQGFYSANIFRDQTVGHADLPVLVVGPNFYRLSGYDKRRVTHIVDVVYGITHSKENGSFMLQDWHTNRPIGVFDQNGLRLH